MSRTPTISIGEQSQRGAWTGQCKALPFLGKRGAKNVKTLRNDGCAPPSEQLRNYSQELFTATLQNHCRNTCSCNNNMGSPPCSRQAMRLCSRQQSQF